MEVVIGMTNYIQEASLVWTSCLLFVLLCVLSFTAGYKWRIIRRQRKIIEQLESQAIEKEELLKILNIKLNGV